MAALTRAWAPLLLIGLPAVAVMALAALVLAGWFGTQPAWLVPIAGSSTMVASTAFGLIVAGVGTLAAWGGGPRCQRVRPASGALLVLLAAAVVAQYAFPVDLGVDLASWHRSLDVTSPVPGRMALPTALAFALCGVLLLGLDRPSGRLGALGVQLAAGAVLALSVAAYIAHDVAPEAFIPGYRFGRMAPTTAAAFVALGIAFLALIARSPWYRALYAQRPDEKILVLTLGIFALVFVALAASVLAVLQRHIQGTIHASLAQSVDDRGAILENVLINRVTRASIVATRPAVAEMLARGSARPDEALRRRAREEAVSYLGSGFRGIAFFDEHGRPIAEAGVLAAEPSIDAVIRIRRAEARLLWSEGFVLRAYLPVHRDGRWVGSVLAEQELELFERLQLDVGRLGATAEWVLCAPSGTRMACFPQRFVPEPTVRPRQGPSGALPMDHALSGRRGVATADDYRGERVIAAFAPVGDTGLGVVLKLGIEEFYAPLRRQALQWGQWFAATALLGALLVASQVRPVAQRLMQSEGLARQRSEALTRSERGLRELYAALGDGIVVFSPDGRIEFSNPAADRLFGYGRGELAGRHVSVLIPEPLREANAAATRRFLEEGVSGVSGKRGLVYPALRRDGSSVQIEFSLAQMRQESEVKLVGVVRDVSERMALERMKSEFIATVSHELRTPLTSIIGSLELLKDSELTGWQREFLEMAARNGERLATLVNDIIDVERIESGALQFVAERFELAPFLREAVTLNQSYAAAHQSFFYLEEPLPEAAIRADRGRLMQVMANLMSNAAKFSPPGEEIRVRARPAGGRVRVEVADRGRGIPEEFKPRVFEKFAQADASDSRDKGGTGLGLAICKAIVERCGGAIGFDSRVGEGTTFWFELPAA